MVEQDISQASPVFSDLRNSNDKYQNNFVTDSTKSINEEPLSSSLLNAGCTETSSYVILDVLSKEESLFDDSSINEQYLNVTKLEGLWQPLSDMYSTPSDTYFEASSPLSFWGSCPLDLETMKIDEVFQVDQDAIFQSPTLAELNANDESLFDSFDCFDGFLQTEDKATSNKSDINPEFKISPFNLADQSKQMLSVNSNLEKEYPLKSEPQNLNLISTESDTIPKHSLNDVKLQTVPPSINDKEKQDRPCKSQLTKRIKCHFDEETYSSVDLCAEKITENSCQLPHSSNNDHFDSDEDSEIDGDYSSDADEESDDEIKTFSAKYLSANRINLEKKKSRYFWQYNMQSKGPKGPKMKLTNKSNNVHDLPGVSDPVFSANCPIEGVKHSGKARRGDGNDLTPNPKKLYSIGLELEKLNCLIDGLIPVNELPMNARTKSRKEKNKLASRACRLKKKAQHEANKLKLFGLQQEQKCLLKFVSETKKLLKNRVQNFKQQREQSTVTAIESLQIKKSIIKVAGCSADFVNNVLKTVASGNECGGLNIPLKREK